MKESERDSERHRDTERHSERGRVERGMWRQGDEGRWLRLLKERIAYS